MIRIGIECEIKGDFDRCETTGDVYIKSGDVTEAARCPFCGVVNGLGVCDETSRAVWLDRCEHIMRPARWIQRKGDGVRFWFSGDVLHLDLGRE